MSETRWVAVSRVSNLANLEEKLNTLRILQKKYLIDVLCQRPSGMGGCNGLHNMCDEHQEQSPFHDEIRTPYQFLRLTHVRYKLRDLLAIVIIILVSSLGYVMLRCYFK